MAFRWLKMIKNGYDTCACGNAKGKRSARCSNCRAIKNTFQKNERLTCSECKTNKKGYNALMCRSCFIDLKKKNSSQRDLKGYQDYCECGSVKTKVSKRCAVCAGVKRLQPLSVGNICPRELHILTEETLRVDRQGNKSCRECAREIARESRSNRLGEKTLKWELKRYGINWHDYLEMYDNQNGLCAICRKKELQRQRLAVDHDHSCCDFTPTASRPLCGGCIRGLLCRGCNVGLAHFRDDPERLESAMWYLKYHGMKRE